MFAATHQAAAFIRIGAADGRPRQGESEWVWKKYGLKPRPDPLPGLDQAGLVGRISDGDQGLGALVQGQVL